MHFKDLAGCGSALLLASGLIACRSDRESQAALINEAAQPTPNTLNSESNANTTKPMKATSNKHLIVSKSNDEEEMVRLGTLNFDASNQASLSTEGSGPNVEDLKKAWGEISKAGELTWKQSRPDEIDGRTVTRIVGVKAKPGDENYIYAVMNTLERKYGYTVDIAK